MAKQSGTVTAFAAEFVQRVANGLVAASEAWFGPHQPLQPVAPKDEVAGRQFDYQTGINLNFKPRSGELVGFSQMRALADGYDLLRLVIETRKDQMAKLPYTFAVKDKAGTAGNESVQNDPRCDQLLAFFQMPDQEHDWGTWLRMLLEDLLVIDAPTVYIRKTLGGQLYAVEPVDGATIKRVLDVTGRTPIPPATAYQQILKGMPAVDYTREELIYLPRNPRTHKVYGYSPVEQIITTVNIALRRQTHQLSYYTDGSTPDLIFQVPESWTPDNVKQFEEYWNGLLSGDVQERRRTRFVPNGVAPVDTKEKALKDEYDEWLARVVCFAFSISAQPFVKEMNRATAQTAQEAALSEGLAPLMQWVKALIDRIIFMCFGWSDIEFKWDTMESIKPKEQAEIDKTYVDAKVLHPDEVRATRFNLQPMDAELRASLNPAPMQFGAPVGDDPEEPPPDKEAQAKDKPQGVAKAKKRPARIDRERATITEATSQLTQGISLFLKQQAVLIAGQITAQRDTALLQIGKATDSGDSNAADELLANINFDSWEELHGILSSGISTVASDGVKQGLLQLRIDEASMDAMLGQVNDKAVDFARERAAELVGKQIRNGQVVDNPNADYSITEATRAMIRADITQAMEEGWSNDALAEVLQDNYAFSELRAESIARTETAIADVEGNLIAYEDTGLVGGKEWLTAPGCCPACADLDGKIVPLDGYFVPGSYRKNVPLHPGCRCDLLPVLTEDMPEDLKPEAADHLITQSNKLLDSVSKGLEREQLSLGDKAWGKSPAAGLRKSIELYDELKESGVKPPITWAVHHWTIDSKYISEVLRGAENPRINPELREEFAGATDEAIKRLNQLFNRKAAKVVEPVTVYRGEGIGQDKLDAINQALQSGQFYGQKDLSCQSTTLELGLAEDFAARAAARGDIPVIYVNELQRNTLAVDITRYHYYHPESEILLGPAQQQLITGLYQREDGVFIMNTLTVPNPAKDKVKKADSTAVGMVIHEAHYDDSRDEAMSGYRYECSVVSREDVLNQYPGLAGKI